MRVYTLKNVLRDGIGLAEVEPIPEWPGAVFEPQYGGAWGVYRPGEWCKSLKAAVAYAEAERDAAIRECEWRLKELRAIRFVLPEETTTSPRSADCQAEDGRMTRPRIAPHGSSWPCR